jgi:hypothetical protein
MAELEDDHSRQKQSLMARRIVVNMGSSIIWPMFAANWSSSMERKLSNKAG